MADLHIDDFYRDVAVILLQLYALFPRKTVLYVEDISGPDEPDEFGLHHPRFEACFSTMVWLSEEHYLRFEDTIAREALDQAVLTRRGFLALSSRSDLTLTLNHEERDDWPPSVSERYSTNIAQLREALNQGSSIAVQECVSYLLSLTAVDRPKGSPNL
ncbi:MAG: hypothetical protein AAGA91_11870 [Pseudomonadota bacterium]